MTGGTERERVDVLKPIYCRKWSLLEAAVGIFVLAGIAAAYLSISSEPVALIDSGAGPVGAYCTAAAAPVSDECVALEHAIWPPPVSVRLLGENASATTTRFVMARQMIVLGTEQLGDAWPRLQDVLHLHCGSMTSRPCDGSDSCVLFHHLQLLRDTNLDVEHYKLYFDSSVGLIDVVFADVQGLQHALATLRQIFSPRGQLCPRQLAHLEITDGPQYSWRGLMVDVARHFIPLPMIKRAIDAMALSKFNTLHLHLTDAQSFPVLLDDVVIDLNATSHFTLPLSQLANKGAFAREKQYSKGDFREIVAYAAMYDIRVVPEVDVPAHTRSWGLAFPGMVVQCEAAASTEQVPGNVFALHPLKNITWLVVEEVFRQIVEVFPDPYVHFGGDEVIMACWAEDPDIQAWVRRTRRTYRELFIAFQHRVMSIVFDLGRTPLAWQDALDVSGEDGLTDFAHPDGKLAVQPWKCWDRLAVRAAVTSISAGHPAIMSSCWYLDWSSTWQDFLKVEELERVIATTTAQQWRLVAELNDATDPVNAVTVVPPQLLLGGEVAMWTEKVDVSNFECRVWPRAGAVAARLWSGRLQAEEPGVMHGFARYSTVLRSAVASTEVSITRDPASGRLISSPSMCPKIAESTQRPIHIDAWKIAQFNIANGGESRLPAIAAHLAKYANDGVLFVGLCELNDWHKLKTIDKQASTKTLIENVATGAGWPFYHLLTSDKQPYSLGAVSALPFQVVFELGPPDMQRGFVHVFIPKLELHIVVAHLHAHDAQQRIQECRTIVNHLRPYLDKSEKVLVMGDMNTLSPHDSAQHREQGLSEALSYPHSTTKRLWQKFTLDGELAYGPMNVFLDNGFVDLCVWNCQQLCIDAGCATDGWTMTSDDKFSTCVREQCPFTEPTKFDPEWPSNIPSMPKAPAIRLDYVLYSGPPASLGHASARVEISELTHELSDHYPIMATIPEPFAWR